MRAILWLTTAVAVLYGGYWVVGSRALLNETEAALRAMKSEGRADYTSLELTGFPSRFDLRIEAPNLVGADGFFRWAAPFLQIYALSYYPNHIIAVLPDQQNLSLGQETIQIGSSDARASAVFGIETGLPLDHAQLIAKEIKFESDTGAWQGKVDEARLAVRGDTSQAFDKEIGIELFGLGYSGRPAPVIQLPETLDRVRLDAVLSLDQQIDRFTSLDRVRLHAIGLRAIEIDLGTSALRGQGDLTLNSAGQPDGRIDLRLTNWRPILAMSVRLGWVRSEISQTIESALGQLALVSGDADVLEMPLIFANGRISLGPFPLGTAPQF